MNYLITAGPTREFFDDVRYLSNLSSGRMGYSLAAAAKQAGHRVVLISGPVAVAAPQGVELVNVTSAEEMRTAVLEHLPKADIIVMCAAVADYRPVRRQGGKIKKGPDSITIELVKTPDILAELGNIKKHRFLIGFALEAENPVENARAKLRSKNADLIVLNLPQAMGAEATQVQVISPDGAIKAIGPMVKTLLAAELIKVFDDRSGNTV